MTAFIRLIVESYLGCIVLGFLFMPLVWLLVKIGFLTRLLAYRWLGWQWLLREELLRLGYLDRSQSYYPEDCIERYQVPIAHEAIEARHRPHMSNRRIARVTYKK